MNIPVRTIKPKFLTTEMLALARKQAAYLGETGENGTAVMINLLVADIEAYREAFRGSAIIINHAGSMLRQSDTDVSEASRSLALVQLKLSVLFETAKRALGFLDQRVSESGDLVALPVAEELRAAIALVGD